MAGKVRTRMSMSSHGVQAVTPDLCPVPREDGSAYPNCAVIDGRYHHANLCPFLYRLQASVGGSQYDVMTIDALLQWTASQDVHGASWTALCLRQESKGTGAGARLRP